jgi:cytochrome P450
METLQALELFAGVVLILVTVLLFRHLRPDAPRTSTSSPPRPRGLPLIGNLHQLGRLPHASLAALAAKHAAPLMLLRLGSVPTLVVSTADAARALFQPNDRALSGRPVQCASTRLSYGLQDITFSAPDSPLWRAARRACLSELLGAPRVRGFRDAREAEAAALIADIADASSTARSPVNLSEKLTSTSNRIVMRVAFGDYGEETTAVLEESQKHFGAFFVSDYVPWLGWVDAHRGLRRGLERYFHELDAFYERLIHDHLSKQAGSKEEDLVDVLLRLHQDPAHQSTFGNRGAVKGILMVRGACSCMLLDRCRGYSVLCTV